MVPVLKIPDGDVAKQLSKACADSGVFEAELPTGEELVVFSKQEYLDLKAILSNPDFERTLTQGLEEFQAGKIVPDGGRV